MGPDPAVAACRLAVRRSVADLPAGALVLVACSGGADSLALAAAALWIARRTRLHVGVVTVDHRLQDGSGERAAGVAGWARECGAVPAEVLAIELGTTGGPEAAARSGRYAALDAAAERHAAAAVLLGHTLDDQAETVLLGLARGSGSRSLAGMARTRGGYRRPFLAIPRSVPEAACAALRLNPWRDPHNADSSYARARVRAEALPALERSLGPGIAPALARTADLLRADADALDGWAANALLAARCPDGLDVAELAGLPAAIRSRVLRRAAVAAGVPAGRLTARHVADMAALVTDWRGKGPVSLPSSYEARRQCGFLRLSDRRPAGPDPEER